MNKLLVSILVPCIEKEFELYLPNNKKVGTIKKYILKSLTEITEENFREEDVRLIDRETGMEFQNNSFVKDCGIKNGTIILLI